MGVCGLRVGEVLGIAVPEDVQNGRLKITGKGHSAAEWIVMPPLVATAVSTWLVWRGPRKGALFIAKYPSGTPHLQHHEPAMMAECPPASSRSSSVLLLAEVVAVGGG